jgi:hypothetical protein
MAVFNEHRSKHNIFVFPISCKHSEEMPLAKIGVSKSKPNSPSVHLPAAQPYSFQKIHRFCPYLAEALDLSGFKQANYYLGINPYAET